MPVEEDTSIVVVLVCSFS